VTGGASGREARPERDDRPPICPACGVTMGIVTEGEAQHFVCLECGFDERHSA
jgi:hypothetical protein